MPPLAAFFACPIVSSKVKSEIYRKTDSEVSLSAILTVPDKLNRQKRRKS